jgi:hypothetical protein
VVGTAIRVRMPLLTSSGALNRRHDGGACTGCSFGMVTSALATDLNEAVESVLPVLPVPFVQGCPIGRLRVDDRRELSKARRAR